MANVEGTGTFIALTAIYVFRCVGFAAARCSVVNGMRIGVVRLEEEAVREPPLQSNEQGVIGTLADIVLEIDGTIGVDRKGRIIWMGGVREKLVQGAVAIIIVRINHHGNLAEVYCATRKQVYAVASQIGCGE